MQHVRRRTHITPITFAVAMLASLLLGLAALALANATPARAITHGSADGNGHPNVGALIAHFADGSSLCCASGTLISPTVFLTGGHDVVEGQQIGATGFSVSFDSTLTFDAAGNVNNAIPAASFAIDPDFGHDQGDFHDLAVLILARPVSGIAPARLPRAGLLDQLAAGGGLRGQRFTTVGYGATEIIFGGGHFQASRDFVRRLATPPFMSLDPTRLFLNLNEGGPCYGDSGGPHFLDVGGTDVIASLGSLKGDAVCRGLDVGYRLDTPSARAFLQDYVALP